MVEDLRIASRDEWKPPAKGVRPTSLWAQIQDGPLVHDLVVVAELVAAHA